MILKIQLQDHKFSIQMKKNINNQNSANLTIITHQSFIPSTLVSATIWMRNFIKQVSATEKL